MQNDYNEFREKIDRDLARDLHQVDRVLNVMDSISKFHNITTQNWKWVRSQDPNNSYLFTGNYLEKNNIELKPGAKKTDIWISQRDANGEIIRNEKGNPIYATTYRYDISQTNLSLSDLPAFQFGKIKDYTVPEYKQLLVNAIDKITSDQNMLQLNDNEKITAYVANQAELSLSKLRITNLQAKQFHQAFITYTASKHFGVDISEDPENSEEIKGTIENWLALKQDDKAKVAQMDTVHYATGLIVEEIEKGIDVSGLQARQKQSIESNLVNSDGETVEKEIPVRRNNTKPEPSAEMRLRFGKLAHLAQQLADEIEANKVDDTPKKQLWEREYNTSLGSFNLLNFLQQVEAEYPELINIQSTGIQMHTPDGQPYDVILFAKVEFDGYLFEFNDGSDDIKFIDGGDSEHALDGNDPDDFKTVKEKILAKLDELNPKLVEVEPVETIAETEVMEKFVQTKTPNTPKPKLKKFKFETFEEAVEAANKVDIVDFAQAHNIGLIKEKHRYRVDGYDSFFISTKKNMFNHFANSESGSSGGTIQFALYMLENEKFKIANPDDKEQWKVAFRNAVNYINDGDYKEVDYAKILEIQNEIYEYKAYFENEDTSVAREYLVNERKIDPEIVDFFIGQGLIRQNKMENVVFPYLDNDEIVGAFKIATQLNEDGTRFRGLDGTNSSTQHGWNFLNGSPKQLVFFESAVDALSYMSLNKNDPEKMQDTWFIETHGTGAALGVVKNYLDKSYDSNGNTKKQLNLLFRKVQSKDEQLDPLYKILKSDIVYHHETVEEIQQYLWQSSEKYLGKDNNANPYATQKLNDIMNQITGMKKEKTFEQIKDYLTNECEQVAKAARITRQLTEILLEASFEKGSIKIKNSLEESFKKLDDDQEMEKNILGKLLNRINENSCTVEKVVVCFDNDKAGIAAAEQVEKLLATDEKYKGLEFINDIPEIPLLKKELGVDSWDYNDELMYQLERMSASFNSVNIVAQEPMNEIDYVYETPDFEYAEFTEVAVGNIYDYQDGGIGLGI